MKKCAVYGLGHICLFCQYVYVEGGVNVNDISRFMRLSSRYCLFG